MEKSKHTVTFTVNDSIVVNTLVESLFIVSFRILFILLNLSGLHIGFKGFIYHKFL